MIFDSLEKNRSRSRGFTAIEFIVSISIIFILLAILMPGIQKARDTARSTQCQNNFKQIALALHNYHDAHQTLPPGYISIMGIDGNQLNNEWGWGAFLLPYLDQAPLYERINFSTGVVQRYGDEEDSIGYDPLVNMSNATMAATQVPSIICPSDVYEDLNNPSPPGRGFASYSPTSYAGVAGIHWMSLPCATVVRKLNQELPEMTAPPCVPNDGAFYLNSRVRFKDIRDGFSQTMILGEVSSRLDLPREEGQGRTRSGHVPLAGGSNWAGVSDPLFQDQVLTATIDGINLADESGHSFGMNSYHDGGVYAAFADGSIRFLSDEIDSSQQRPFGVLQHLSTISGNDLTVGF